MVCLHSAPVRVPSRVPSPQSPLVGTHTLHCHSPQSDFFTFFSARKEAKAITIQDCPELLDMAKFTPQHLSCGVYDFHLYLHFPERQLEYARCLLNVQANAWLRGERKKTWGWGTERILLNHVCDRDCFK